MKHKRQHVVPSCYLSAWLEPVAPVGQERALWKVSKDGSSKHRRSPQKTFVQSDRYTVFLKDGTRDLKIEHTLDKIENDFAGVSRRLHRGEKLTILDKAKLAIFTGAMLGRTTRRTDDWGNAWKDIQTIVKQFEGDGRTNRASGSSPVGMPPPPGATRVSSTEIDELLVNVNPDYLVNVVETAAPILFAMDLSIYSTDNKPGFLTSDDPCIMDNPTAYRYHPMRRSPGLRQRDVQVLLPLSPRLLIAFTHKQTFPYITPVPQQVLDDFNRLVIWHANEEFISWTGEIRSEWFMKPGPPPADAWEMRTTSQCAESAVRPDFLPEEEAMAFPEFLDE